MNKKSIVSAMWSGSCSAELEAWQAYDKNKTLADEIAELIVVLGFFSIIVIAPIAIAIESILSFVHDFYGTFLWLTTFRCMVGLFFLCIILPIIIESIIIRYKKRKIENYIIFEHKYCGNCTEYYELSSGKEYCTCRDEYVWSDKKADNCKEYINKPQRIYDT